jgi:hypothetical protein
MLALSDAALAEEIGVLVTKGTDPLWFSSLSFMLAETVSKSRGVSERAVE